MYKMYTMPDTAISVVLVRCPDKGVGHMGLMNLEIDVSSLASAHSCKRPMVSLFMKGVILRNRRSSLGLDRIRIIRR